MLDWIIPEWSAPSRVRALSTTRSGGFSRGPYRGLNLADHVGDSPEIVAANRRLLRAVVPAEPLWLRQVHGSDVIDASAHDTLADAGDQPVVEADAVFATARHRVCVVMTADCLPVLFCDRAGSVVAAAHAGWRGLAAGVLETTLAAMRCAPEEVLAWLGPAIGAAAFEVGDEVRAAFVDTDAGAAAAFVAGEVAGKWRADLFALARRRLAAAGVGEVSGGGWCTHGNPELFYSHRRDQVSGRMATLIWLD